jgi:hypothetical protein
MQQHSLTHHARVLANLQLLLDSGRLTTAVIGYNEVAILTVVVLNREAG